MVRMSMEKNKCHTKCPKNNIIQYNTYWIKAYKEEKDVKLLTRMVHNTLGKLIHLLLFTFLMCLPKNLKITFIIHIILLNSTAAESLLET